MPAGRVPTSIKAQFVYGGTDNGLCFYRANLFCQSSSLCIPFTLNGKLYLISFYSNNTTLIIPIAGSTGTADHLISVLFQLNR